VRKRFHFFFHVLMEEKIREEKQICAENLPFKPTKVIGNRYFFSEREEMLPLPSLIEVQHNSFEWFLQEGVKEIFEEISPITDFSGKKLELHFLSHKYQKPKFTPLEARRKMTSFESNLVVRVRLVNKETGEIKEQEVFLGAIPMMTDRGTFVVNGIERVVVNQLVRSPGAFFSENSAAPGLYNCKVIPRRGAWLEIETDKKGIITAKIDRKRKIPVTQLLRIFGFDTDKKILDIVKDIKVPLENNLLMKTLEKDGVTDVREAYQSVYRKIRPGDMATPENAKSLIESMFFDFKRYDMGNIARHKMNRRFGLDIPNNAEGRVFQTKDFVEIVRNLVRFSVEGGMEDDIDHLANRRVRSVGELVQNKFRIGLLRTDRIAKDRMTVIELESITPTQLINSRPVTAAMREFFASSQLSQFMDQTNPLAELAHKRRLSAMGPGGLSRERASFDVRDVHQSHYGRICPISTPEGPNIGLVVHLATYAKVNDLGFIETPFRKVLHFAKNSEKDLVGRRLDEDILGVGKRNDVIDSGMAKKIASEKERKEVKVRAFLGEDIIYFDAEEERNLVVAQANSPLDEMGQFLEEQIPARKNGEPVLVHVRDVTHIDVSPKQIISETTALIPFLEHDDNTRAAMGSNMQRQAVPIISPDAPIVGTGMEAVISEASGQCVVAPEDGEIVSVDANEVVMMGKSGKKKIFPIDTFVRTNQSTCFTMRVRVFAGQKINKGDVIADGASVDKGEIAIGRNLVVAYMAWNGYNFEDAIIISDRIAKKGMYDSIHIDDFIIDVRETKLGPELITRDIPNVAESKLSQLDADGIIRVGAAVSEGDILVGKITPKGETELTPEERLLQAIFGEKAKDVKDSSLRLPGGGQGKVVDVQIFSRENGDDLPIGCLKQVRVLVAKTRKIQVGDKMAGRHGNKGVVSRIVPQEDMPFLPDGTPVDIILNPLGVASRMNIGQIFETHLGWAGKALGISFATPVLRGISSEQIGKILEGAGLPKDGKVQLFDGNTGEPFDHKTTVGIAYMLKLNHLVEDKIHARSVGPYSIVTQQPLGGKAQHGGQRFGEMEVWALEAYGAAHTLQEMLTIKSDDIIGRSKAYEAIVKRDFIKKPSTPESFNVLVYELRALGMNVNLKSEGDLSVDFDEIVESEENMEDASIPNEDAISEIDNKGKNIESDEQVCEELSGTDDGGRSAKEEMEDALKELEDGHA
jgi:DNA-directed RNA polymerase subunit beta